MIISLPYPPSINHYYRQYAGRTLISRAGRAYRKTVVDLVCWENRQKTMSGRLQANITLYPPDARRRDIDNVLKALLDALQHAEVYADDSQLYKLNITKQEPRKGGSVSVEIKQLERSSENAIFDSSVDYSKPHNLSNS
jgi:crossover junction endodeoxyribonuclease RusA